MAINFAAASTAGLNNPGTEIITLVKDGSGNFINPPSYDKMRAYLRSGEVPMLFVTDAAGETGSLYQLAGYSETENKIHFSNDTSAIEFCAGCAVPVVSDVAPKPLTYDYMPEGYPKKTVQITTLLEERKFGFYSVDELYYTDMLNPFKIVVGETYTVKWDEIEYECAGVLASYENEGVHINRYVLGNLSIRGAGYDDTGEPFLYEYTYTINEADASGAFVTRDTSASHTISVKTTEEIVTPMAEEFIPNIIDIDSIIMKSSTADSTKKFKITVDDSGNISASEVTVG